MKRLILLSLLLCVSCQPIGGQGDITSSSRTVISEQKRPTRIAVLSYSDDNRAVIQLVPDKTVEHPVKPPQKPQVASKPVSRVVRAKVTSYCPCERCCRRMTGLTSTQTNAWQPGVAVAPGAIPYGSLVRVPGYDRAVWAVADDTGAAMRNSWNKYGEIHVDVRMTYHWQARDWGTQYLTIEIREP